MGGPRRVEIVLDRSRIEQVELVALRCKHFCRRGFSENTSNRAAEHSAATGHENSVFSREIDTHVILVSARTCSHQRPASFETHAGKSDREIRQPHLIMSTTAARSRLRMSLQTRICFA